ncbi:MAG: 16S rRNA (adenine(1518)-N(6)/adenine(1519)-N(6))-dimethyltransferase RsmA [Flavobacteriales bacterium]|nr:16S rRNA (adenine(1518)-N(6)/adenine(1519)-N(6))-dimethyltransferase RsmA [Flavobacteriales bacterium]MCX7767435.1 16S rRNA (adenine(1518)-N(6)/adenine(1519)-N(6))-dimethyltransferase RsmA [Flavobacteriales bacterium]MDW8410051.1 16S rRNA (adenine(1518)-N(6)/adenine(1519)-N(6))-dimethyltransferase RsmA [Flavobacteriales bacterium]
MNYLAPRKRLGQHFLRSASIAARIAEYHLKAAGNLPTLEVGAGQGILTRYLLQAPALDIVELDIRCIPVLTEQFGATARILQGDFLKIFPEEFLAPEYAVIGNFPYNISSQILIKVLDHRWRVPVLTGMFQREVARRIVASPGSRDYGILSVFMQAFYHCRILMHVAPSHFHPPPAVWSSVIQCLRKPQTHISCSESLFRNLVKTAFSRRRKKLRNNLVESYPALSEHPAAAPWMELRAEQLSWQDYATLTKILESLK